MKLAHSEFDTIDIIPRDQLIWSSLKKKHFVWQHLSNYLCTIFFSRNYKILGYFFGNNSYLWNNNSFNFLQSKIYISANIQFCLLILQLNYMKIINCYFFSLLFLFVNTCTKFFFLIFEEAVTRTNYYIIISTDEYSILISVCYYVL